MPIIGSNILAGSSGQSTGVEEGGVGEYTGNSLTFDDGTSQILYDTPAGEGNRGLWTFSCWIKRHTLGSYQAILGAWSDDNNRDAFRFTDGDVLNWQSVQSGSTKELVTNRVFRDTSAWYHIVLRVDTSRIEADRYRLYINGVEETDLSTNTAHSGSSGKINDDVIHWIGARGHSSSPTVDSHGDFSLAAVALVDGQSLAPSSFGHFSSGDDGTGAWVMEDIPVAEAAASGGTETTNVGHKVHKFTADGTLTVTDGGLMEYLVVGGGGGGSTNGGGGGAGGFRSGLLQVPAGSYSITVGGGGAGGASGADNIGAVGADSVFSSITSDGGGGGGKYNTGPTSANNGGSSGGGGGNAAAGTATSGQGNTGGAGGGSSRFVGGGGGGAGAVGAAGGTGGHPQAAGAGGAGLASDIIIKGTDVTYAGGGGGKGDSDGAGGSGGGGAGGSTGTAGTANTGGGGGASSTSNTGGAGGSGIVVVRYFTDSSLDFGTNGFYQEYKATGTGTASASTIGADTSGKTNHYTSTNFAATDSALPDTPVNNFCTLNTLSNNEIVLSEGNLTGTGTGSNWDGVTSTFAATSGKWYWEVKCVSISEAQSWIAGIHETGQQPSGLNWYSASYVGQTYGVQDSNYKVTTGSQSAFTSDIAAGDIVQFRLNLDDNELSVSVDGVDKGKLYDITDGKYYSPAINMYGTSSVIMNFGQDSSFNGTETATSNADGNSKGTFHSAVPTDYLALCTSNLPEIEIGQEADDLATDHFNTVLYTGTGAELAIAVGFQPAFVWIKTRALTYNHRVFDVARGVTKELYTNTTNAEVTDAQSLKSFDSNGFTLGTGSGSNPVSAMVSWNWKLGTAFSNDASATGIGDIDTTGQVNQDAGFSCFTYTGSGTAGDELKHGLTTVPHVIIVKRRNTGNSGYMYHHANTSAPETDYLEINSTNGTNDGVFINNDVAPTTSVIQTSDNNTTNASSDTYVMWCWSEVEGYSKFGSYTGNGNADGTFVHCGFEPAFVMTKRTDSTSQWGIWDNKRSTNPNNATLYANTTDADVTTEPMDFLSNGFKLRNSNADPANASGGVYIFMAFSSGTGFKYGNAN
jgi:hypothetical protein